MAGQATIAGQATRIRGEDRRQQILQVAMQLFAHQGFEGTTTRQIAEKAGVNEAIIFRHFPHKEELYWAVIEDKCRHGSRRKELEARLKAGASDDELFAAIAEDILRRNAEDSSLSRLLLFSALENHRLSHEFFHKYVADFYAVLATHIRERMREGKFRDVDPLLAARGFVGMVFYHHLTQDIFGPPNSKWDIKKVSRMLADIWLRGMLPGGDCADRKSSVREP